MKKTDLSKKKIYSIIILVFVIIFMLLVTVFIGTPLVKFANEPDKFRSLIENLGFGGHLIYMGMLIFQIIFSLIPGEPFEILAGYTFGAVEGTILCLVSSVIGSSIVFLFTKKFGIKFVELFFSKDKIDSLKILHDKKRMYYIIFLAFFIPGTPKDLLSYVAGLTPIKFLPYIILSTIAKIPSVITSTIGGNAVGDQNYFFAALVFIITGLICLLGIFAYNKITKK